MTEEEVWYELSSVYLTDDILRIVCRTLVKLPDHIQDFAIEHCLFLFYNPYSYGSTFPPKLFTNRWVIMLNGSLAERDDDEFTVAHEIAHAYLDHDFFGIGPKYNRDFEKEADELVSAWGLSVPEYRKACYKD